MLRIERIHITGFKSDEKNVQILFSPSNVSIIFGLNGCGKTSVLKILHAIFTQDESILIENHVNTICLYYSNDGAAGKIIIKNSHPVLKIKKSLRMV